MSDKQVDWEYLDRFLDFTLWEVAYYLHQTSYPGSVQEIFDLLIEEERRDRDNLKVRKDRAISPAELRDDDKVIHSTMSAVMYNPNDYREQPPSSWVTTRPDLISCFARRGEKPALLFPESRGEIPSPSPDSDKGKIRRLKPLVQQKAKQLRKKNK